MIHSTIAILFIIVFSIIILPFIFIYAHIHIPRLPNYFNPASRGMEFEDISTTTEDNINLKGWYIPHEAKKGTILVCHGVAANKADVLSVAEKFHKGGYEIYMFDFRGHGDSDKARITYGYDERKDIKAIVQLIKNRGINEIGIFGLSMGGAIVLLSAPENPEIKAIIVDSTFASAEKILKYRIGLALPDSMVDILANIATKYTNMIYKVQIKDIAPINVIDKINRPIMFIIGSSDTNIIPDNGYILFEKAKQPKELYVVQGADHTETISDNDYESKINQFMDNYLGNKD